MKLLISFMVLLSFLYAGVIDYSDMLHAYKTGNYKKVCRDGKKVLNKLNNSFISIVGDACAKEDDINILGIIISKLNKTKNDRANASYFATLILQKKLIYQFMNDHINLSGLVLPKTTHILSRVFQKLTKNRYKILDKKSNKLEISDYPFIYILWLSSDKPAKVYIQEYKESNLIKIHWFR